MNAEHPYIHFGTRFAPALLLLSCTQATPPLDTPSDTQGTDIADSLAPKVLLIIADDLGVDAIEAYNDVAHLTDAPRPFPQTPTIDALCSTGVRFDNAWAMPTCTPTRGSLLTGEYGFRTGLDGVGATFVIDPEATTLPRVLSALDGFTGANIGKWHLGDTADVGGPLAPNELGWSHYSGSLHNIDDYYDWPNTVDGVETQRTTYATTANVDDAIAWWTAQPATAPSLLWLAFHAPHVPFHSPPDGLHHQTDLGPIENRYDAAIEAIDTELARLLDVVGPDTLVIFLGDNGTPARVIRTDDERAKGTLYQGGVHVPLCISGAGTQPGRHTGLVQSVDLFRTITDTLGLATLPDATAQDSLSLVPILQDPNAAALHTYVYAEQNRTQTPNSDFDGGYSVRSAQYKWIRFEDGTEELYDLVADPTEQTNRIDDAGLTDPLLELRTEAERLHPTTD